MRLRYLLMSFPFFGAMYCALMGVQEYQLAAHSSREPEEISLRGLIKRGPDGNPNIILTDYAILDDYVYKKEFGSGRVKKVWVPVVPADEEEDDPGKPAAIRVFLFSEDLKDEAAVRRRFDKPRFRGMIHPDTPKPGIIGSVLIERRYPGTDPNTCIIIEEGKEPAGTRKLVLLGVGSVLLAGLTGGIWILARMLDKVELEPDPSARKKEEAEPVRDVLPAEDEDR